VDVALEIVREDENDPTATLKITSRFASVEPEQLTLNVESLTWQSIGSAKDYKKTKREMDIMTAIEAEGEADIPTLSEALDLDPAAFRHDLKRLVAEGLVNERKQPTKGRPKYLYSVTSEKPLKREANSKKFSHADQGKGNAKPLFGESHNPGVSDSSEKPNIDLLKEVFGAEIVAETETPPDQIELLGDDIPF
jgi:DNA-binding MarR family transcriptional regulator